jgi:Kef-type K+ transport system membrane component KefB
MQTSSSVHATEALLFFTLLQFCVIVAAGRIGGMLAKPLGQAAVVGEVVIGILLGPSLFGWLAPDVFDAVFRSTPPQPLTILSQVGLLFLMFQIGLEFDFGHLTERRNRFAVASVSIAGLVVPFALGIGLAVMLPTAYAGTPDRTAFALFVATALSITALPVLGRIMMEFDLTRTSLGVIAISAAAVNDVVGWLLLAMVTALTHAQFSGGGFAFNVSLVAAFVALCWWGLRPLLVRVTRHQMRSRTHMPAALMGIVICCIFAAGMATYKLGIFAIFGGFMVGVMLHDQHEFVAAWKERVGHFVNVFFLPIFFTYTGLRTDIGLLGDGTAWLWCVVLILVATLGKFGGCYVAARIAGLSSTESKIIGAMMNTRGLMELVVINVGFDLGVIGPELFTMLVLMAIVSTVATSPALRRWLPGVGAAASARRPATS